MTAMLSPLRVGRITGSRVGAVLGLNKYQSREDVLAEMVAQARGQEQLFVGNDATQWGQDHERDAIEEYERQRGAMVYGCQTFVMHDEFEFLAVTIDGIANEDLIVEVKAPFRAQYTSIKQKPEYEAQVQLQLACMMYDSCDFLIWRQREPLIIERVGRDRVWLDRNLPTLRSFMDEYQAAIA